ncbi:cystathionine gamma-synthase family protein [Undibacterium sp. RTI2.1]|uniref:cystathionine gamma-synthase family protein n=1 Tax=unclassified Undibacterium TaxID=2630295 RepID=UPI002AB41FD2|nr:MULTISPECIES: cystathionine gamma-synthase family protein [unclassified Undibacterium]MDY7537091.1 cystathionine gamma-synthase family protein [Undibacterium sp. 5I1]MEB0029870.1 cystathionine gamma-synthase family protein [Undibacterium sp. RTI2.1]MEB0115155.1 cystathionine gamma-synthase family protein [Undibacterium sp. RTI2.2]MEB0229269.1 cystathionine gamma-synthase family protein [Undibacterium sp. 10I3]MEB0256183.1 cystathionine gamma-synthase family protein [Undibacterium sp. 5I1]
MSEKASYGFTTTILHNDRQKEIEHGSVHKPIHTSVLFGYKDARDLAAVFQGKQSGYRYGRQGNPTVSALEDKLTKMEDGHSSICFATGMAAIGAVFQALLRQGDHVVSSSFLFGNTNSLWQTVAGQGVDVSFVDATNVQNVAAVITPATRIIFVETIANPRTQIADLKRIGALCKEHGILFVVDNTMTSPYLFRPKVVGAGLVVNSLTKSIAGHGNVLGGALTDTGVYDWSQFPHIAQNFKKFPTPQWGMTQIRAKGLRDFGASLSPEAAHQIAVGAETIALRLERECANAMALAMMLENDPRVAVVHYPGLPSHPQHPIARELFLAYGALFSFELKPEIDCFDYLNRLKLAISATHLGDTRTLVIPVAHTIFFEMGAERRGAMGIADSLIRVSVGIEDTQDLLDDFQQALSE